MNAPNTTKKGVLLALSGVLILSPDSLIVRLLDVPFNALMFWRGFFMFLCLAIFLLFDRKKQFINDFLSVNKVTLFVSVLFTSSTFLFVMSLQHTSVAHTLLIVGTSPVFTAVLALLILKENVSLKVWAAIAVIVSALFFVVQQKSAISSVEGDVYAVISSIIMGYLFVFVRQHKEADLIVALSLSGLWIAIIAVFLDGQLQVETNDLMLLFVLGGFVGAAFSLITLSARFVPAAITSMFMPLETVFGIALVGLFIGEKPSVATVMGGLVIILSLVFISINEMKAAKPS